MGGDLRDRRAGRDMTVPADEAWHSHAPLVDASFRAAHPAIEPRPVWPVVREEDDNGLFVQSQFSELRQQTTQVVVDILDHPIHGRVLFVEAAIDVLVEVPAGNLAVTINEDVEPDDEALFGELNELTDRIESALG